MNNLAIKCISFILSSPKGNTPKYSEYYLNPILNTKIFCVLLDAIIYFLNLLTLNGAGGSSMLHCTTAANNSSVIVGALL